mmetsp:Transcript_38918/g.90553  ORF Transcript_38918/g.90553 Transcript_38918/m.90553 type:complete len:160 (-) Transcript_38918:1001-1480(-)
MLTPRIADLISLCILHRDLMHYSLLAVSTVPSPFPSTLARQDTSGDPKQTSPSCILLPKLELGILHITQGSHSHRGIKNKGEGDQRKGILLVLQKIEIVHVGGGLQRRPPFHLRPHVRVQPVGAAGGGEVAVEMVDEGRDTRGAWPVGSRAWRSRRRGP